MDDLGVDVCGFFVENVGCSCIYCYGVFNFVFGFVYCGIGGGIDDDVWLY